MYTSKRSIDDMRTALCYRLLIGPVAFALVVSGCSLFGSEELPFSLRVETDRDTYHLARDSTIEVSIQNTSQETIYHNTCLGKVLEMMEDDRVVDTIGLPVCSANHPAQLGPGEEVASTVSQVYIASIARVSDRLRAGSATSYRIAYTFYQDEGWDEHLPQEELRSNRFALQLP